MTELPDEKKEMFSRNISALESVDEKLENIGWPSDLKFLQAVDGTQTAFSESLSNSGWFARSSSPSVRGKVMAEKFSAGEAHILLPGTGHGETIKLLLKKFRKHQSIFVWEPETLNIAILLCLHDFSDEIKSKQLIFLNGKNLEDSLTDYFSRNNELSVPTKMLSWPWISETRMQELSLQIEKAIETINSFASKQISELQLEIEEQWENRPTAAIRKIQIVSLSSSLPTHQLARDIASAAENPNIYLLDRPQHTSNVSLLREINNFNPDLIISIASTKNHWPIKLPESIPFVSFITAPSITLNQTQMKTIQPDENEILVLGSTEDAEYLTSDRFLVFDIAVNAKEFRPLKCEPEYDLIIHADISETDPEKYGISQKSHQKLWKQAEELISKNPLGYSSSQADDLLNQASRFCDVKLSDSELFKSFCELIQKHLAPAAVAKAIIGKLSESDLNVKILPTDEITTNQILNSASLILILNNETNFSQILFDALASGSIVILKKIEADKLESFSEIKDALVYLDPDKDIVAQIENALKNKEELKTRAERAGRYITENHSYTSVLQRLLEAVSQL